MSGNSSCSGPGRMTAPERLWPPQVFAFSMTATGTSPRRSERLRVVGQQLQQAVGAGEAGGAAADDRHADLDPLVLASSPRLTNSLGESTGGGNSLGATWPLPF